uniref:EamA domain-containing protein n=1 Tax=Odontella aurita TaxID=265563 RepID=A0A7S4JE87_9STRA|mmetsp:Transcript_44807/g.136798  ORF Transcript_44807/g.136798 Transcript_44807/m.136798 type:complete len:380 (+) Transcript_44807:209-1348(+)
MTFALGISAALVAPFMMVLGFTIWDNHWGGSAFSLNMYKCNLAAIGFAAVSIASGHTFLANEGVFTTEKVGFLMLSSTIGILIGDWTWLEGMRLLGARKIIVMDSLKPFLAALLGEVFLAERLKPIACIGLVLTVVGVSLVGLEKELVHEYESEDNERSCAAECDQQPASHLEIDVATESNSLLPKPTRGEKIETVGSNSYAEQRKARGQSTQEILYGLIMGLSNVVLHTFGALLTKKFGVGMTTWEINFIRFGFAGVCMMLLSIMLSSVHFIQVGSTFSETQGDDGEWFKLPSLKRSAWIRVFLGVCFVTFLTPALTNYAMFQIPLALLLTLESTGPIYSLPLSLIMQQEHPTFKACSGALLAVAGIVVLSFKGTIEE